MCSRGGRRRRCCPPWWLAALLWLLAVLGVLCLLRKLFGRRPISEGDGGSKTVPSHIYRRPDPLIYSQKFLMEQGLAVTWDNPDIHLEREGAPVPSSALEADVEYDVVARVWNGSPDAPVIDMPVRLSYLDFGIGTTSIPVTETRVDLPVKGAPGLPAEAWMKWRTPQTPGHYCLQVELVWPDDANPANNLGQENVDVAQLNSPRAALTIPVRNDDRRPRTLTLEVDAYQLPAQQPCPPDEDVEAFGRRRIAEQARGSSPIPEGWTVEVHPARLALAAAEDSRVEVVFLAPDGFDGRQPFNVNALEGDHLYSGVTVYVEGSST